MGYNNKKFENRHTDTVSKKMFLTIAQSSIANTAMCTSYSFASISLSLYKCKFDLVSNENQPIKATKERIAPVTVTT